MIQYPNQIHVGSYQLVSDSWFNDQNQTTLKSDQFTSTTASLHQQNSAMFLPVRNPSFNSLPYPEYPITYHQYSLPYPEYPIQPSSCTETHSFFLPASITPKPAHQHRPTNSPLSMNPPKFTILIPKLNINSADKGLQTIPADKPKANTSTKPAKPMVKATMDVAPSNPTFKGSAPRKVKTATEKIAPAAVQKVEQRKTTPDKQVASILAEKIKAMCMTSFSLLVMFDKNMVIQAVLENYTVSSSEQVVFEIMPERDATKFLKIVVLTFDPGGIALVPLQVESDIALYLHLRNVETTCNFLRAVVCNSLQLYMEKNWEEFKDYLEEFAAAVYKLRIVQVEKDREARGNKGLSEKQIRLKIFSPTILNIILVNLPKITNVPVGDQPSDIETKIRNMILSSIRHDTCIILAVSPRNADLSNFDALQMTIITDPHGSRTIGDISKLDIMDRGTDACRLLKGYVIPFKLGYISVVNRSQHHINQNHSIQDALAAEEIFFQRNPVYHGFSHCYGVLQLAKKLNQILIQHIKTVLPGLKSRINAQLVTVVKEQATFGDVPDSKASQGVKLLNILAKYSEVFYSMVEGKNEESSREKIPTNAGVIFAANMIDFLKAESSVIQESSLSTKKSMLWNFLLLFNLGDKVDFKGWRVVRCQVELIREKSLTSVLIY